MAITVMPSNTQYVLASQTVTVLWERTYINEGRKFCFMVWSERWWLDTG